MSFSLTPVGWGSYASSETHCRHHAKAGDRPVPHDALLPRTWAQGVDLPLREMTC